MDDTTLTALENQATRSAADSLAAVNVAASNARKAVRAAKNDFRRYRNSTLVAFLILAAGTGYAIESIQTSRAASRQQICQRINDLANTNIQFLELARKLTVPPAAKATKFYDQAEADVRAAFCPPGSHH